MSTIEIVSVSIAGATVLVPLALSVFGARKFKQAKKDLKKLQPDLEKGFKFATEIAQSYELDKALRLKDKQKLKTLKQLFRGVELQQAKIQGQLSVQQNVLQNIKLEEDNSVLETQMEELKQQINDEELNLSAIVMEQKQEEQKKMDTLS